MEEGRRLIAGCQLHKEDLFEKQFGSSDALPLNCSIYHAIKLSCAELCKGRHCRSDCMDASGTRRAA